MRWMEAVAKAAAAYGGCRGGRGNTAATELATQH